MFCIFIFFCETFILLSKSLTSFTFLINNARHVFAKKKSGKANQNEQTVF